MIHIEVVADWHQDVAGLGADCFGCELAFDLKILVKSAGSTVAGAYVEVKRGAVLVRGGTSDAAGSYTIKGLPAGDYNVFVEKTGFKDANKLLTVTKHDSVEIALTAAYKPRNGVTGSTG